MRVDFLTDLLYKLRCSTSHLMASVFLLLVSFMVRLLMGLGSYSGQNDPPRYGDFEAQRHWMELTTNSSPEDWYRETPQNDLTWWRLDYPPLSGYLAWFLGHLSHWYDPASVELQNSQGVCCYAASYRLRGATPQELHEVDCFGGRPDLPVPYLGGVREASISQVQFRLRGVGNTPHADVPLLDHHRSRPLSIQLYRSGY